MYLAGIKVRIYSVTITITCTVINCLHAADLGWNVALKTILPSYFNISTENILRCGKLCEKQGKCAAVTFDTQYRRCYMHAQMEGEDQNGLVTDSNRRYLFKNYSENPPRHALISTCDVNTQIIVPSVRHDKGACYNIEGLIGHSCTRSTDCIVSDSECRADGVCGCPAHLIFQPENQTCGTGCSQYGSTFHVFRGMYIYGYDFYRFSPSSPEECMQKCKEAVSVTCRAFEIRLADMECILNNVGAYDKMNEFQSDSNHDFYQRDCF